MGTHGGSAKRPGPSDARRSVKAVDSPKWTIGIVPDADHPASKLLRAIARTFGGELFSQPAPWMRDGEVHGLTTPRAGNQRKHWTATFEVLGDGWLEGGCPAVLDVEAQSLLRAREVAQGIAEALTAEGWTVVTEHPEFGNLDPDHPDPSEHPRRYAVWPYSLANGVLIFDESAE